MLRATGILVVPAQAGTRFAGFAVPSNAVASSSFPRRREPDPADLPCARMP
jgi:hypothetical protein